MFKNFISFLNPGRSVIVKDHAVLYKFDSLTGFWGIPNAKSEIIFEEYGGRSVEIYHNNDGNRDTPYEPKGNTKSVLCIGGSHSWGTGVSADTRYSEFLRQKIDNPVVNMGHPSLGLDQICLAILKKSKKFNPGIIVIEQYPWSVTRVINTYVSGFTKPYFSLEHDGELKLHKVPKYARFKFLRKLLGSFYSYRKELNEFRSGIDLSNDYDPMKDPICFHWKCGHYDYLYALLEQIILVIRDHCKQNNIKLIFALGAIFQQLQGASPSALVDYNLPRTRLMEILDKLGVDYVDVSEPTIAAHSADSPATFSDGHINEKGNQIFAQVLHKDLEARGWL